MTRSAGNDSAIEEFTFSIGSLLRLIRSHAPPELREISMTQKSVLSRLEKDGPSTIAALARVESVTPQSMGIAIGGLEDLGFIKRDPHPTDGRQMNIDLSSKGKTIRKNIRDANHEWLKSAIAKLTKQEQATLFKASGIIKRMTESSSP